MSKSFLKITLRADAVTLANALPTWRFMVVWSFLISSAAYESFTVSHSPRSTRMRNQTAEAVGDIWRAETSSRRSRRGSRLPVQRG